MSAWQRGAGSSEPPSGSSREHDSTHPAVRVARERRQSGGQRALDAKPPSSQDLPLGMASTVEQLEAFRELRTRLVTMAARDGRTYFTTLVVPVTSGSGGSFVCRNLAAAFTLENQRVSILLDCNLRHPDQHQALRVEAESGLFDYLDRRKPTLDLKTTMVPRLRLLPAGNPQSTLHEYFSSPPMRELMGALRETPCYLLLDGPAARGSPDARILSEHADLVLLVAGYGHDSARAVADAVALFDPAKFAGVVFNELR